eukprot:gene6450-10457_t
MENKEEKEKNKKLTKKNQKSKEKKSKKQKTESKKDEKTSSEKPNQKKKEKSKVKANDTKTNSKYASTKPKPENKKSKSFNMNSMKESLNEIIEENKETSNKYEKCLKKKKKNSFMIDVPNQQIDENEIKTIMNLLNEKLKQKEKEIILLHIDLQENNLNDDSIELLIHFLLEKKYIHLTKLRLWKNKIGNKGAKLIAKLIKESDYMIDEIHLSHNKIQLEGSKDLFDSIANNHWYSKHETKILWLRLEWNFIDYEEAKIYIKSLNISFCEAVNRKKCGTTFCVNKYKSEKSKVHLYVFYLQYQEISESKKMNEMKNLIIEGKEKEIPLYIFLDTCSLIKMLTPSKETKGSFAKNFTFKKLIEKAKEEKFGAEMKNSSDKVYLIITDTVIQEIDYRKKMDYNLRKLIIPQIQSERGYLSECMKLEFLEVLGAHQGELLNQQNEYQIFDRLEKSDRNHENDLILIEIALSWNDLFNSSGNVILISDDNDVVARAKRHNLPAEFLMTLDKNLDNINDDEVWTSSVIKNCIPNAMFSNGKMINTTPLKKSINIYEELEIAAKLIEKLLNNEKDEKLIEDSQMYMKKWKEYIKTAPTSLRNVSFE